jgi:hypothetical protein
MQVGAALGVAVLGTAMNIRYQSYLTPLLAHLPIPAGIKDLVLGSLGGALAVAPHAPPGTGALLAQAARHAFISGMDVGLVIASAIVAVAAGVILIALPSRQASETLVEPSPGTSATDGSAGGLRP